MDLLEDRGVEALRLAEQLADRLVAIGADDVAGLAEELVARLRELNHTPA